MNRNNYKNKIAIIAILFLLVLILPKISIASGIDYVAKPAISFILATIGDAIMSFIGLFLSMITVLLNLSMSITLNISEYVKNIKAVEEIWVFIRNLSSIFIIFALIYTSIMTVLGESSTSIKKLVMNIIMAGMLINFSLFFTKTMIDASNLISLQFYTALSPDTKATLSISSSYSEGGIANVFMSSLSLQRIYNNLNVLKTPDPTLSIFIASMGGIIMMIVACFSFLAISLAIIARTAILIFIMAVSPLYFAGMIFPEIRNRVSSQMFSKFMSQLIFLPLYMFLMYISLRIISSPGFMNVYASTAVDKTPFGLGAISVLIQYIIAIFFINLPLVIALEYGAVGAKWAPQSMAVSKWFGDRFKDAGGFIGRKYIGGAAKNLGNSFDQMAINNRDTSSSKALRALGISQSVRGALNTASKYKYGGSKSTEDYEKEDKEREKQLKNIERKNKNKQAIKDLESQLASATPDHTQIKNYISSLSTSEIADLSIEKVLTNKHAVPYLSSEVYKNIEKSDKTELEKAEIRKSRAEALNSATTDIGNDSARKIISNMTGSDIKDFIEDGGNLSAGLIENLREKHLKDLEGLDAAKRKVIGESIFDWTKNYSRNHPAYDYIVKNMDTWS